MSEHKGFCVTLWQLISILRPFPAALLVLLSILETALVAKGICACCKAGVKWLPRLPCIAVGQVAGQYYLIIVDRQPSTFLRISLISLALYLSNTLVKSSSQWLSELLALR